MHLSFDMGDEPDHENLAISFNTLVAASLLEVLTDEGLDDSEARRIAEFLTFDLAMLFDQGFIKINGKKYQPRVGFVDENGDILAGAAEFDFLHEYAASSLDELENNGLKFVR